MVMNKKNKNRVVFIVISILIALLLILTVVKLFNNGKNDSHHNTTTVESNEYNRIKEKLESEEKYKGQGADKTQNYVGHIYFPNKPTISYPLAQYTDNDYYLIHDIFGNKSIEGSPFLDYENKKDLTDPLTIIYGHSYFTGSNIPNDDILFTSFRHYQNKEYLEKNKIFYIKLKDKILKGTIFAYHYLDSNQVDADRFYVYNFPSQKHDVNNNLTDFINMLKKEAKIYDDSVKINNDDHLIIFSTCYIYSGPEASFRHAVYAKITEIKP